jgi:hypothetical protein
VQSEQEKESAFLVLYLKSILQLMLACIVYKVLDSYLQIDFVVYYSSLPVSIK